MISRNKIKIVIVDYGIGNTHSVHHAIASLGYSKINISHQATHIEEADALILPGVGAFDACARNLAERNLPTLLNEQVLVKKKPILGICVGMQLMATDSEENGLHHGLNWIPGHVKKLVLPVPLPIPHVGWNNVKGKEGNLLFTDQLSNSNFYFDHTYHYECDQAYKVATCDYGIEVTAAIQKDNITGVQFHPEKSQTSGLRLFRSFLNSI